MEFKPHSEKQDRAIFSERRILVCGTGIQWGKTRVGAIRQKVRMHRKTYKGANFLITAPTYKIMQQSTLPAFLKLMHGCGHYSKQEAAFLTNWGTTCFMRTGTDPDSVVGITDVEGIWCDEAGKYSLGFWENIQARAALKECPIDLTTSPYALNWIFKEIIRPKLKDPEARPDVELIQATSAENPYFPFAEFDRRRATMDPRRFNAIFGGRWEKMAGLVFDCFDEVENTCEPFALPPGTVYVGGVDEGFTNPFVLKVRAITPDDRHYDVFEVYQPGLSLQQKLDVARQAKAVFGVKYFLIDPSAASLISAFNEARGMDGTPLRALPADNDIKAGIDDHYELVKSRRYKVFRGTSPHTMDEYETYHYPEDESVGPDDDVKELKPVKQKDHAMDVSRYISRHTRKGTAKRKAVVGGADKQEDQHQRLERLKRRRQSNTERWGS